MKTSKYSDSLIMSILNQAEAGIPVVILPFLIELNLKQDQKMCISKPFLQQKSHVLKKSPTIRY